MEHQRRLDQSLPERKGQKRKLEEEVEEGREVSVPSGEARRALLSEVAAQLTILNSTFSWKEADRAAAKRATHILAELAKNVCKTRIRIGFDSSYAAPLFVFNPRSSGPPPHPVAHGATPMLKPTADPVSKAK